MAFNITEATTAYFINNKIELPRFQRKATWDEKDNFKLCISVFKGYPIGVVIVNSIKNKRYLLDGRQRRNALIIMYRNPVEVYRWASKFIGIKKNMSEQLVRTKFSEKIAEYLQSEFDKSTEDAELINKSIDNTEDAMNVPTFDAEEQDENMHLLLDYILLSHGSYSKTNLFEGMFKFDGIIPLNKLEYKVYRDGDYFVDPAKLKMDIENRIINDQTSEDTYFDFLIDRYNIQDDKVCRKPKTIYMITGIILKTVLM